MSLEQTFYIVAIISSLLWIGIGISCIVAFVLVKQKLDQLELELKQKLAPVQNVVSFLSNPTSKSLIAIAPIIPVIAGVFKSFRKKSR